MAERVRQEMLPPQNADPRTDMLHSVASSCQSHGSQIELYLRRIEDAGNNNLFLRFTGPFSEIESEIQFVVDSASSLSKALIRQLACLFQQLEEILASTSSDIAIYAESYPSSDPYYSGRRIEMDVDLAGSIGDAVQKLEAWHSLFLQRLFLVVLLGEPFAEPNVRSNTDYKHSKALRDIFNMRQAVISLRQTQSPGTLEIDSLRGQRDRLPDSQIFTLQDGQGSRYIVEYRDVDEAVQLSILKETIRDLMYVLSQTDPLRMGILRGFGFSQLHQSTQNGFELLYEFPMGFSKPRSLRNMLLDPENAIKGPRHSISERFELARQLARAILFIHITKNVHKSVRPETILLFEPDGSSDKVRYPYTIGQAYIVGFENMRKDGPYSTRKSDGEWEKDIYRHPDRQGLDPEKSYSMRHDIYSLGVVFLEIAMWKSFLDWSDKRGYRINDYVNRIFNMEGGKSLKPPREIQSALMKLSRQQVPLSMGTKFAGIVEQCLDSLEGSFAACGDVENEDEMDVGIRYIEVVLDKLEKLSV
ncbi:hypothetical protein IMSHALPRED_008282 [Imshaugia aleurites]|uniref:Protein kinase domain-containing protein n=1 Tax=Imshaugia aleurites TaxID=172621 RepID=A0A8H3G0A1_9LECA|nr:hypothetical protein IMSHALPRED_008282 [Imshaugia aleurites]